MDCVREGALASDEALSAAEDILGRNAARLYGVPFGSS
jgi:hypothetical protein